MSQLLKMSEAASIGIHAMVWLLIEGPEAVSVKRIASVFSVSEAHCSKVMQRLTKAGLVLATRGPSGGFRLAVDPDRLSMLDVYEAIEGRLEDTHCFFLVRKCESGCVFGDLMKQLNGLVRDYFGSVTLRQAAEQLKQQRRHEDEQHVLLPV